MNKYGIEHFTIEQIEEVKDISSLEDRERYWIEYYGSFKNGYNATKGGDGKSYLDYELIYSTWLKGFSAAETAKIVGCFPESVIIVLKAKGITKERILQHAAESAYKPVCKIDIQTNEILKVYPSVRQAEKEENILRHIGSVCRGKRKTAGGYKWKYLEDINVSDEN